MTGHALKLLLALALALPLAACGGDDEEEVVDETPIVGLMEIPISRNNQGARPSDAALIEISSTELRLDHRPVLTLERGRPAADAVNDNVIGELVTQLRTGAARNKVAMKVQATVPYLTLAQVLHSVEQAGIHEVHFAVRTLGESPSEGWFRLPPFSVVPHEGDVSWNARALPWSAFSQQWRPVYEACRAGEYIDCDAPYTNIAEGGELEMELWTRGQGMKVTFSQINAPEPEPGSGGGGGVEMIEGIAPTAPPEGAGEEEAPPATTGAFTVRHQEATKEDSAISNLVQPVCGNSPCRAIVVADATGMSMRVISFLGAVFANGFTPGEVAFRLPE